MTGTRVTTFHEVTRRVRVRPRPVEETRASVTVVIPCYNYAAYLPEAISSALTQEGVEVDVVVVDDASDDSSAAVAQAWADSDPRVQVLRHGTNQGPVTTFNDGLALARAEFVVRLDADDLLTPGSLARSVAVARAFPSVGLVYGRPLHFEGRLPTPRGRASAWTVWPGLEWLEARCRSGVNVITSPEVLMRRSVVDVAGGQRDLAHTHDMEMWFRLAAHADVAYVHGADQAWHREHPASLSHQATSGGGLTILRERRDAFRVLFAGGGEEAKRLLGVSEDCLANEALTRAAYAVDRGRADPQITADLVAFAEETSVNSHDLRSWRRLQVRVELGSRWRTRRPWVHLRPVARVAGDWVRYQRWLRHGVYEGR